MGKLLSGLIAAILMAGGLTALTIGAAEAGPYTGTVDTQAHADNLNNPRVGQPARVQFRVTTDGNGGAGGEVTFAYQRVRSGNVVAKYRRDYDGPGWDQYAFRGLPRGRYNVRVFFNSQPRSSAYRNSSTSFRQTVRPRA